MLLYVPSWWWCDIAMHSYVLQSPPYFNSYGCQESGSAWSGKSTRTMIFLQDCILSPSAMSTNEEGRNGNSSPWAAREGGGDSPNSSTWCCACIGASPEQTVDLDAKLDIMKKKYEQSFLDKENGGGASPSSDFGFWGTGGRKTEATSESADHEPHVYCGISHLCVFMYCSLHTAVIRVYHFIFQQ